MFKEYYKRPDATAEAHRRRRLFPHRRRRLFRRGRAAQDHRPRQGRGQDGRTAPSCAELHREQAQVLSAYQGGGRFRPRARDGVRLRQHRHRRGRATGPSGATSPTPATPTSRKSRRCTSWCANAWKRSTPSSRSIRRCAIRQVHRFLILHKELDPDDDELTRTRKVRRGFIAEKYGVLIDALYSGKTVAVHRDAGEVRGRAQRQSQRRPAHRGSEDLPSATARKAA